MQETHLPSELINSLNTKRIGKPNEKDVQVLKHTILCKNNYQHHIYEVSGPILEDACKCCSYVFRSLCSMYCSSFGAQIPLGIMLISIESN